MRIRTSFRLRVITVFMAFIACWSIVLSHLLPLAMFSLIALVVIALANSFRNHLNHHLIIDESGELLKVSPGGTAIVALLPESRVIGPLLVLAYDDSGKIIRLALLSDSVASPSDWRQLRKWVRSRKVNH